MLRYDGSGGREWQAYSVEVAEGATVLHALEAVRDQQDETLAFRAGCGGGLCGSCGMLIKARPGLACATPITALARHEVQLEPLPGFEPVRDLVVDFKPMHGAAERMRPYLLRRSEPPEGEFLQSADERAGLAEAARCVFCGCCVAACPVWRMNRDFLGPAAAVRGYRFLADTRDEGPVERLAGAGDEMTGVWRCRSALACTRDCPLGIDVARMMARWRAALLRLSLTGKLGGKRLHQGGRG